MPPSSGVYPEVYVVGSVNADLVVSVERRPGPGETVAGSDVATLPGGKGANQAVAVARLGGAVGMLGRVGDDPVGGEMLRALADAGVDVTDVRAVPGASTGVALIMVTPDGENSIVVCAGANGRCTPDALDEVAGRLREARVLVVQRELPDSTVRAAVLRAREVGSRVVLNAAPAGPLDADVLAAADPLVANQHEAAVLLGADLDLGDPSQALDAAQRLRSRGPSSVVVTQGAAGAVYATASRAGHVHAPLVRALDTTGAGDAFVGALALVLARGGDLDWAVRAGVRAGSHAVRGRGAQSSFPGPEVLEVPVR